MRLDNFEQYINRVILERGYNYYIQGRVRSLVRDGAEWTAEVEGSEDYAVTACFSPDGELAESFCDCPYDLGEYCKHQAAVFYALRDETADSATTPVKPAQKASRKVNLEKILQGLSKAALTAIILELAEGDKHIKDTLLLRFAGTEDISERAGALVRGAVKRVMRQGFVDYDDIGRATEGAEEALALAEKLRGGGDILNCVKVCIIVAEEMMVLMDCCDDSDGYVGGMVSDAVGLIGGAAEALPENHPDTKEIFRIIIDNADGEIFDGWSDWRLGLMSACVPLCGAPGLREELEARLLRLRMRGGGGEWGERYINSGIQKIALELITRFDGPGPAAAFIEQNLENSDFRKIAIERALAEDRPDRALELCLDGERRDAAYPGLVKQWKTYRYAAYERQKDINGQRSLASEFVQNGEFEYFIKLKALYKPGEWGAALERLLDTLSGRGVYARILAHEGMKRLLLAYCQKDVSSVLSWYPNLLPEYKNELAEMFEKLILLRAEQASGRSHYKDVCGVIKHYAKACGKAPADALRRRLTAIYPRRPAFLDELGKLSL